MIETMPELSPSSPFTDSRLEVAVIDELIQQPEFRIWRQPLPTPDISHDYLKFDYHGITLQIPNNIVSEIPNMISEIDPFQFCIYSQDGKPLGIINLSPQVLTVDETTSLSTNSNNHPYSPTIHPPDQYESLYLSTNNLSPREVIDYLIEYQKPYGIFAPEIYPKPIDPLEQPDDKIEYPPAFLLNPSSLDEKSIVNLTACNPEGRIALFKIWSQAPELVTQIINKFHFNSLRPPNKAFVDAINSLATCANKPSNIRPLNRLVTHALPSNPNLAPQYLSHFADYQAFYFNEPQRQPLPELKNLAPTSSLPDHQTIAAQTLAWLNATEMLAPERIENLLSNENLDPSARLYLIMALKNRVRNLAVGIGELLPQVDTDLPTPAQTDQLKFAYNGLIAHITFVKTLTESGLDATLASEVLPAYFWQQYRLPSYGINHNQAFFDSLTELWELTYTIKEGNNRGVDTTEAVSKYYKNPLVIKILQEGAQTTDTETELTRKITAMQFLIDQKLINPTVPLKILDFGCWDGLRMLQPIIEFFETNGVKVGWPNGNKAEGVDVTVPSSPILDGLHINLTTFASFTVDMLPQPADLSTCDWSSIVDNPTLTELIKTIININQCTTDGGIFYLDTVFPMGPGSYDAMIELAKSLNIDIPEGQIPNFHHAGLNPEESHPINILYPEIMYRLIEQAGFKIITDPPDLISTETQKRLQFFADVANNKINVLNHQSNPLKSPIWKTSQNRPRNTFICQKIKSVNLSNNLLLAKLASIN